MNIFYAISSYINNNNSYTNPYFYNSIYTISNYIPINSDINLQNNFNTTAITNPTIINGICHRPSDGAFYSSFNLEIA